MKKNSLKANNLKASAYKYFNDLKQFNNLINLIEKIINDKDYHVIFDKAITNDNGVFVEGQIGLLNASEIEIKHKDAYSTQNNNWKGMYFSIRQDDKGNEYVNVDIDQDIFDGKNLFEQAKIAKKIILEKFRDTGGINFNNKNITLIGRTANEYTHPKKQLPIITKESKMRASTELDNLIKISKYSHSCLDDGRHSFAKDGWDYYETKFKVGDNVFTGLINIGKKGKTKTLYDITNIKRISQNRGKSAKAFSTSLANSNVDNISLSNENVNTITEYSMQKKRL